MSTFKSNYNSLCVVNHEGTPIVIGLITTVKTPWIPPEPMETVNAIAYQIMDDQENWTGQKNLEFPHYEDDESVEPVQVEVDGEEVTVLSYRYKTEEETADNPIQAVSDGRYIYVFRQSTEGKLYVDRFIYDEENMQLVRPWQVRYQESGEKYQPAGPEDVLSYENPKDDGYFYEPTTELSSINLESRDFSVQLLPTSTENEYRWAIFSKNSESEAIDITTFGKNDNDPFDPNSKTIQYEGIEDGEPVIKEMELPGYTQTSFVVELDPKASKLATTIYSRRAEMEDEGNGNIIVKTDVRLMLGMGLPIAGKTGVIDFGISKVGTLADLGPEVDLTAVTTGQELESEGTDENGLTYYAELLGFFDTNKPVSLFESVDGFVYLNFVDPESENCYQAAFDTLQNWWVNSTCEDQPPQPYDWMDDLYVSVQTKSSDKNIVIGPRPQTAWQTPDVLANPLFTPYTFGFDRGGDIARIFELNNSGDIGDRTYNEEWNHTYDIIFPFKVKQNMFLFTFDRGQKKFQVKSLSDDGQVIEVTDSHDFQDDYDYAFPFELNNTTYLFLYDNGNRKKAVTFVVDKNGKLGNYTTSRQWDNKYDFMFPFHANGNAFICAYQSGDTKEFRIMKAAANVDDYNYTAKRGFEDKYDFVFPYLIGNDTHLFFYDSGNRKMAKTFPVNKNGELGDVTSSAQWDNKYSVMFPFQAGGKSFICAYESGGSKECRIMEAAAYIDDWNPLAKWELKDKYNIVYSYTVAGVAFILFFHRGDEVATIFRFDMEADTETGYALVKTVNRTNMERGYEYLFPYYGRSKVTQVPCTVEFGTLLSTDEEGVTGGKMKRCQAFIRPGQGAIVNMTTIDELDVELIGINTINPVLLGFLEGAPPVPSENMTNPDKDYEKTTELVLHEEVTNKKVWTSSSDIGINASVEAMYNSYKTKVETSYSWLKDSNESVENKAAKNNLLPLLGTFNDEKQEFEPVNKGMAIVLTAKANVYAMRLKDDKKTLVGYRQDIQEDQVSSWPVVFPINPEYVKNGDLDSYYHNGEAANLDTEITRQQTQLEAYYQQYDANAFNSLPPGFTQKAFSNHYAWAEGYFEEQNNVYTGSSGQSIGGAFKLLALAGYSAEFNDPITGSKFASLEVLFGGHIDLTVTKSEESTSSLEMNESMDPTNLDHIDLEEGQVDAYSWYSFYQDPQVQYFDDFFNKVVDPDWLANSEDQDAQTLKDLLSKRKPVWRVRHMLDVVQWANADAKAVSRIGDLSMFSDETKAILERAGIRSMYQLYKKLQLEHEAAETNEQIAKRIGRLFDRTSIDAKVLNELNAFMKTVKGKFGKASKKRIAKKASLVLD